MRDQDAPPPLPDPVATFQMKNQSQKGDVNFVDILNEFESFSFPRRFIYLRGIAFSGPYR